VKKNCEIDNFVGIMVGGLSYWFNPYDELSLLGISIYKLMGAGAFWVL
jgi:hypothetical protein